MEPKALAVPAVAQGLQGAGQRGPGSGCRLPPSTGHAAASGCARPGHPARGGSPSPAPWALRSPGVPLGQGRGAAPSRVPAACRGGSPSGAGDPLGTAPQQGSAGRDGAVPYPCAGDGGFGSSPWPRRPGLVPARAAGGPGPAGGDTRAHPCPRSPETQRPPQRLSPWLGRVARLPRRGSPSGLGAAGLGQSPSSAGVSARSGLGPAPSPVGSGAEACAASP